MAETIKLSTIEGGGQWWKSIKWAEKAFTTAGLDVKTTRYGRPHNDPLARVVNGESDVGITLSIAAGQSARGIGFYKDGRSTSIRGLAHLIRPDQHFLNSFKADLGIRSFAEIAQKKPKLDLSMGELNYASGAITEAYLRHYGVEVSRDIEAWGGSIFTSHPGTVPAVLEGKCNAIMWNDTPVGPTAVAAQISKWVLLPLDRDIAEQIEREFCAPVVTIPAGTLHGQTEDVLSVTNPGFELIINKELPDDVAYRLAKALNESSTQAWMSQDVFYSIWHAAQSSAPLHPGAARYYKELGVLK
jgi:TRAP-type uncharacterized transport system substrate-binding protein